MTLSDKKVRRALKKHFVLVSTNTAGNDAAGSSFEHGPKDPAPSCIRGNGEHNVQLLFTDAQGRMINALSGFIEPEELLEEIAIARQILDIETQAPAVRKKLVVSIHQDAARRAGMVERTGPLSEWETRRAVADHKFSAKKALMPVAAFRIEEMVGNGKTFFGSSRGGKPEGRLGKDPKQPGKKGRTTGSK